VRTQLYALSLKTFVLTAEIAEIEKVSFSAFSAASAVRYGFPEMKILNPNECSSNELDDP
jgi:hypothetical protein